MTYDLSWFHDDHHHSDSDEMFLNRNTVFGLNQSFESDPLPCKNIVFIVFSGIYKNVWGHDIFKLNSMEYVIVIILFITCCRIT